MKSSRERTILITVLGVAGLGLLIDRVVIGSDVTGPAQSSAGVIDSLDMGLAQSTDPALDQILASSESGGKAPISFAQRLRTITDPVAQKDPAQTRDAFSPGSGWGGTTTGNAEPSNNQGRQIAEAFQRDHVLEAVFLSGDKHCAVIGGQTLFVGQELDGFKLTAVHERRAIFQGRGVRVEIGIQAAGSPSP